MVAQSRSRADINEANAKHERNIVRLRTGHRATIANAIGAMGFPAAIAPEQNALIIAQPHYVESIRRFDPTQGAWVEADDRTARVVGSHMNDEGRQGPILESQGEEYRPFWAEDNPENKLYSDLMMNFGDYIEFRILILMKIIESATSQYKTIQEKEEILLGSKKIINTLKQILSKQKEDSEYYSFS
jgi:hypothetical protein